MSEQLDAKQNPQKNLPMMLAVLAVVLIIIFGAWLFLGKQTKTDNVADDTAVTQPVEPASTDVTVTDSANEPLAIETSVTVQKDDGTTVTIENLTENYTKALGDYSGTWNDPTFNLYDKELTGSLADDGDGGLVLTLNLYGLTFGLADPQTISAVLGADGSVSFADATPLVSGIDGSFDPVTGAFGLTASSPILGEDAITFDGSITVTGEFSGTAVVAPAGGGELEMTLQ